MAYGIIKKILQRLEYCSMGAQKGPCPVCGEETRLFYDGTVESECLECGERIRVRADGHSIATHSSPEVKLF